jgi:hypothetical protein
LVRFGGVSGFVTLIGCDGMDAIIIRGGGRLVLLEGIVVTHVEGDSGRGVCVERDGTFVMFGGEISGNIGGDGGGVYNKGVFVMFGGKISDNKAVIGGGVYNFWGNFSMFGGEISGNMAEYFGGGVNSPGDFYRGGGVIFSNKANGRDNDVDGVIVDARPVSNWSAYLFTIGVVIFVGVVGLLVYRSKKRK